MGHTPAEVWSSYKRAGAQMIVVTGEIGAGKTTWCCDLITQARTSDAKVAGLASPAVFTDGQKIAIDLLNLANNEQLRMADRLVVPDAASPTPNWKFYVETLAWGNTVLKAVDTCDLLVIDELGPLELQHNQGWQSALPLLKQRNYRVACVVVRRSLLRTFLAIFPDAVVIEIKHENNS